MRVHTEGSATKRFRIRNFKYLKMYICVYISVCVHMYIYHADKEAMFQTVILKSINHKTAKNINLYMPVDEKVYFSDLKVCKLLV